MFESLSRHVCASVYYIRYEDEFAEMENETIVEAIYNELGYKTPAKMPKQKVDDLPNLAGMMARRREAERFHERLVHPFMT